MVDREGVWESAICYAGWISAAEENCLHRSSLYHFQSCSLAACGSACPGKLWPLQAASVVPPLSYFRLLPRLASLCINDRIKLHPTVFYIITLPIPFFRLPHIFLLLHQSFLLRVLYRPLARTSTSHRPRLSFAHIVKKHLHTGLLYHPISPPCKRLLHYQLHSLSCGTICQFFDHIIITRTCIYN